VDAAVIAKKIIAVLARPLRIRELELTISVSVGIGLYPLDGDDVETLMKKADDAMYKVKKSAKGGFRFFSDVAGASSVSAP
jgi:GGDEF domain-containing protein